MVNKESGQEISRFKCLLRFNNITKKNPHILSDNFYIFKKLIPPASYP
jgi:hypothetical protein